jgi:hypothetical protein
MITENALGWFWRRLSSLVRYLSTCPLVIDHIKHLLFCFTLVVVLFGGELGLGHFIGEINKLVIFEGFGDVMSIFKIALDVEEGLFFDFGVGSISLRRPSWLEGVELHGWFLDGWFLVGVAVGRLLGVDALTEGLSRADRLVGGLVVVVVGHLVTCVAINLFLCCC